MERTLVRGGHILVGLSVGLGGISLLGFTVFLFAGSLGLVDLGLGDPALLAWDLLLSLVFFLQHSLMIRKSFHIRAQIPHQYAGVVYSISSSIPLLLLIALWQESDTTLLILQGPFRWGLRAIFVLSILLLLWGVRSLGALDTFGTGSLIAHMKGRKPGALPFSVRGPYRWVRHPLYLFVLLLIWSCPDVTLDRLLFNVSWTAWVVIGTILEERDLVGEFGEAYRTYQKRVPMLIPYRIPASE